LVLDAPYISLILTGVADAAAKYTSFEGFTIDSDEAATVAEPAARILARHPEYSETVAKYADPVALVLATVALVAPRILAYKWYQQMVAQQIAQEAYARSQGQQAQHHTQPQQEQTQTQQPKNGTTGHVGVDASMADRFRTVPPQ
jgi:beta-lactam-binding protein with PASTA domain